MKTTWDFVTKYYPNYDSCDDIAYNDDLHKLSNGQMEEESGAETLYKEIEADARIMWKGCDEETIQVEIDREITRLLNESNATVYQRAIEGYLETLKEA